MNRDIAAARQLLGREHAALGADELKRRLDRIKARLLDALRGSAEKAEKSARSK